MKFGTRVEKARMRENDYMCFAPLTLTLTLSRRERGFIVVR